MDFTATRRQALVGATTLLATGASSGLAIAEKPAILFDESNITWGQLDWLENVWYYIYDVDEQAGIVDVMFKFAANKPTMLHTHHVPYITHVVQGELRFYNKDGSPRETRYTGSYVNGHVTGIPHAEGGGPEGAIVFFSNRNVKDLCYEFWDKDGKSFKTFYLKDFRAVFDAQVASGVMEKTSAKRAPKA